MLTLDQIRIHMETSVLTAVVTQQTSKLVSMLFGSGSTTSSKS